MHLPEWRNTVFQEGVLPDLGPVGDRRLLWLPGDRDGRFQYWQRVGNLAGGEITVEEGLCTTTAIVVPARQRLRGWIAKLLGRFRSSRSDQSWLLPNGESVERVGRVGPI